MMDDEPEVDDLPQILEDWISDAMRERFEVEHGPLPATVRAWNATTQTIDAQPVIQLYSEGALVKAPIFRDIPVSFPGSTLGGLTYPISTGSHCHLVPQEADCSAWFSSGTVSLPPKSDRRFSVSDLVAWPLSPHPATSPLPSSAIAPDGPVLWVGSAGPFAGPGGAVYLGDSTATDFVALAAKVLTELGKIETAFNNHVHLPGSFSTPSGAVVGTSGAVPPPPIAAPYTKSSVAASLVKAK